MVRSFQADLCKMKAHLSTDEHDESDSRLVEFIGGDMSRSMRWARKDTTILRKCRVDDLLHFPITDISQLKCLGGSYTVECDCNKLSTVWVHKTHENKLDPKLHIIHCHRLKQITSEETTFSNTSFQPQNLQMSEPWHGFAEKRSPTCVLWIQVNTIQGQTGCF